MNDVLLRWMEDSINFGIFTTDKRLVITSWNRWLEINTGKNADSVIGKGLFDVYPEIKKGFIARYYNEALEGKTSVLSQRLHQYILPVSLDQKKTDFAYMQQSGIISPLVEQENTVIGTVTMIEDVTERIESEKIIAESEERYRLFINASSDMVFLKDENLRYILANKVYIDYIGKASDEIIGKTGYEFRPRDIAERCMISDRKALEAGSVIITEERSEGRTYEVRKFPVLLSNRKYGVGGYVRDITEAKDTMRLLNERDERLTNLNMMFRAILDINKMLIRETNIDRLISRTCEMLVELRGYSHALILLMGAFSKIASSSNRFDKKQMDKLENLVNKKIPECIQRAFNETDILITDPLADCPGCPLAKYLEEERCVLIQIRHNDKAYGILSVSVPMHFLDNEEEKDLFRGVANDIALVLFNIESENRRREIEDYLRLSEEKYRTIFNNTGTAMIVVEEDTSISLANENALRLTGFTREELEGEKRWTEFVADKEDLERMTRYHYLRRKDPDAAPKSYEFRLIDRFGVIHNTILTASMLPGTKKSIISIQDITDLRIAQRKIEESEERYRSIFVNAVEGIFQTTSEGRIISANPALAKMFGFESPEDMISSVKSIGSELYEHSEDREIWKEKIERFGEVKNFEVLAKRKDGSHFWISFNARAVRDDKGKILFYEGTVEDISVRKKAEENLKLSFKKLRRAIGAVIDVIAFTVESRDPYTAGHQKKVANLARAIANEMGLSQDIIESIRMAGAIHDLGKISIPAEILSMPRKLTHVEFGLIKEHPTVAYNILKDVDFEQPVAQMVYQHHERLDGSGYPNGLRGDQILIEARILTVADVVEAIASHRPYRPALGIEIALDEIKKNRGVLYDEGVVDACLKLFQEKGFTLS